MDTTTNKLFVYGSLRKGFKNPAYTYLSSYFSFSGEGKVRGIFYEKENILVAVPTKEKHYLVGEVYTLNNIDEFSWAFEQLDDYEGMNVLAGEQPLYQRKLVEVIQNDKTETAWVYWYNGYVENLPRVETGDLLQYLLDRK